MEVIDHILSVYRENGKYETYREELEYLVLANAYFEPSKELVLDAIFEERRFEFIWEPTGGFNDLNRRGRFIEFIKKKGYDVIKRNLLCIVLNSLFITFV